MNHNRGPRPHMWVTGPDPELHVKYKAWLQHRNQAQWRGEAYLITFEDFVDIWGDLFEQRGRYRGDWQMIRQDPEQPWHRANITLRQRITGKFRGAANT